MITMLMLFTVGICVGLYIFLEAVDDSGRYSGKIRFCLVARDVCSGVGGLMVMWYTAKGQIDWLHIVLASSIALYLWPKMVYRMRRWERGFKFWGRL